jgi:hypothetical protein
MVPDTRMNGTSMPLPRRTARASRPVNAGSEKSEITTSHDRPCSSLFMVSAVCTRTM